MTKSITKTFNIKLILIPAVILNFFLLVYYIIQVGALSQEIYLIDDYKIKLGMLLEKNKFLDINFSKMNSLSNIDRYLINKNFVKTNGIKYIQILEASIASKTP